MAEGFKVEDKRQNYNDEPKKSEEPKTETATAAVVAPAPEVPRQMTFAEKIMTEDILAPWIENGAVPQMYTWHESGNALVQNALTMMHTDLPWIYVNSPHDKFCNWYKQVDSFHGFIHKKCLNCWKVVVVPKNVKQLFQLLNIEFEMVRKNPNCFCKCGIESRPDVERNYGGYFYCNSMAEGLVRLTEVRKAVRPVLGEDTVILLKRGCTEYERKYGDSRNWDALRTPEHDFLEEQLDDIFKLDTKYLRNPELVRKHTMAKWISFAADRGDVSLMELNGGRKVFPGYVTYDWPKEIKDATN